MNINDNRQMYGSACKKDGAGDGYCIYLQLQMSDISVCHKNGKRCIVLLEI